MRLRRAPLLGLFVGVLLATSVTVVAAQPSQAAAAMPLCPTVPWDGGTAFRVEAPPNTPSGESPTTTICYVETTTVNATGGRPIFLQAGYELSDRDGDGGDKSLVYAQILCFDSEGDQVFKHSVNQNLWNGSGAYDYYPRALFHPPEPGDHAYDCGVRIVNQDLKAQTSEAVPVYAISGYLNRHVTTNVAAQDGAPNASDPPAPFPNGQALQYLPRGESAGLRRVQINDVPTGVTTLHASSNVNFSNCSWTDWNQGRCPSRDDYGHDRARFRLRIVAWQTMPNSTDVCRYLAGPNSDVPWKEITGDQHHRGITVDADLTLVDDPDCTRNVVIKTVIEMDPSESYDAAWAHSQSTVLSAYGL